MKKRKPKTVKTAKKLKVKTKTKAKARASKPAPRRKTDEGLKGKAQYQHFFDLLNEKRQDILSIVKDKEAEVGYEEIGDEADVASQTFEREMMYEVANGERIILDDIEAALRKIEKDDFGNCESCHNKISAVRLNAMPWARYCIACQSRAESPA